MWLILKGTEASLSYVHCFLYLVSSSINYFSYFMAGYLLDRPGIQMFQIVYTVNLLVLHVNISITLEEREPFTYYFNALLMLTTDIQWYIKHLYLHALKEMFVKHIIALVCSLLMMQKDIEYCTFPQEVFNNLEEGRMVSRTRKEIIIVANNLN